MSISHHLRPDKGRRNSPLSVHPGRYSPSGHILRSNGNSPSYQRLGLSVKKGTDERRKGQGEESVKQNSGPTQAEKNSKVTNLGTQKGAENEWVMATLSRSFRSGPECALSAFLP